MWELRTTFSEPNPGWPELGLETSSMLLSTRAEAEEWFKTRTKGQSTVKRTCVMIDPNGYVIKTVFC